MSTMKVEQMLHMIGGAGVTSYAANSKLQEKAIQETKSMVEEAMIEVYNDTLADNLVVADLGCSTGPNAFLLISQIINTINSHCQRLGRKPSEIQFFLNDLPGNDFNTLFQHISLLQKLLVVKEEGISAPYYIAGVPGSFYGSLFPSQMVHFIHSSYSLHWLSQVPPGLESDSADPLNKGSIHISNTSPSNVIKSYLDQFKSDFSKFLRARYKELVNGGRMVLTFLGRKSMHAPNGEPNRLWGLLADALNALAAQGSLLQEKVDTFNLPVYAPSLGEVKEVIENEKSFSLDRLHTFSSNWDPFDDSDDGKDAIFDNFKSGENVADYMRAVLEPMLARHFGDAIMDELFSRFAINVANHLIKEKTKNVVLVVSLKKIRMN